MSGSTCPKLAGQWFAEIDRAASIDELIHFGFAYSPCSMDFETLDANIVKGIAKIIPRYVMGKIDILDENIQRASKDAKISNSCC